jgi:gluconolactonase
MKTRIKVWLVTRLLMLALPVAASTGSIDDPAMRPGASVDLTTEQGVRMMRAGWRYSDARVIEIDFKAPDADGQPTGTPVRTYDIMPRAGAADFDDSAWRTLAAESLDQRRGTGRLSFNWYRIRLTVPERIGDFDTTGATLVFSTSLDDYAEVWVDGELPRAAAQAGGSVIAGWNATNRLVIGRNLKPGQQIQLAVFGANGPLSDPPTNFIWMRLARLDFYPGTAMDHGPFAVAPHEVNIRVERRDAGLDAIVPANPKLFKLAEGFQFTEGPVWVNDGGYLLFSDPNHNTIYKYQPGQTDGTLNVFREKAGYDGADIARYHQPGSNGLTLDGQGRLTLNQHGKRRVIRLEPDGRETVLADRDNGRRLNSPNDLVYRDDGTLFFTDPPFGLPEVYDDPARELSYNGVYCIRDGEVKLLDKSLPGPNGIAFSPDSKYLYVGDWDDTHKAVMRYTVAADCTLSDAHLFFDMTAAPGEDAIDGVKVDQQGNVYISGPGGLWIVSPQGKHLGTVLTPRHVHNMAWGDADGKTLYLCAQDRLYRMRLNVEGVRPEAR